MAKVGRLNAFSNIYLIGDYAEQFGMDPDEVFARTAFRTVINFSVAYKERDEYEERFTDIYRQINDNADASGTRGGDL